MPGNAPRRILIVQLRQVGDVLLTSPLVRSLHTAWPEAEIDFLVEEYSAEAARGIPNLSEVVVVPRALGFGQLLEVRRRLAARGYDLCLDSQSNQKTGFLSLLSGARRRVGFEHPWYKLYFRWFYTESMARDYVPKYSARYRMDLLRALSIPSQGDRLEFQVPEAARARAERFLSDHGLDPGRTVALGPGGRVTWKSWPYLHYLALGRALCERGYQVLVLCGPGEEAVADRLVEDLGGGGEVGPGTGGSPPGAGPTGSVVAVRERSDGFAMHAGLLARVRVLMGNDGGNLHLAAALGTPTVTVYGPTDPEVWGPPDQAVHRRVAHPCECAFAAACVPQRCLAAIGVEAVLAEVMDLLEGAPVAAATGADEDRKVAV